VTAGLHYREALASDVPALARIRAAMWGSEQYWQTRIAAYMERKLHPQKSLPPRVVYVATEDGSPVGLIAGHLTRRYECEGELEWIDVVRDRRGSGVAAELLRRLAEWFVAHQASRVCVDVEPANAVARNFYARHGAEELNPHWLVWPDIKVVLGKSRKARTPKRGRRA
jgi:GNAT superfamily N-acetyltransferase